MDSALGEVSLVAPETLRFRDITVSKTNLTAFLIQSIQELAHQLSNNLFLGFSNFLSFQANPMTLGVSSVLVKLALADPEWLDLPNSTINYARANQYLATSGTFLKTLLAAIQKPFQ
ncbi:hypothetical protein ARAM_007635 [Aspergillus rambellii]|uniref:Uncharacterized protein n=1 Tax=Aspergillus rambellii TaxID=308745 RepID=A0A0F8UNQ8_9EURO|nr:hypothetical protein ARAM_007635 [Aspergillus rambellii]